MTSGLIDFGNLLATQLDTLAVDPLCVAVGRPADQIRIFVVFLFMYPQGWIMHYFIHGTTVRHIFNIVLGIIIQMYVFGFEIFHVILMSAVAYAMMAFLPRHKQAPVVMMWVLAYLSYNHLSSIFYNVGSY